MNTKNLLVVLVCSVICLSPLNAFMRPNWGRAHRVGVGVGAGTGLLGAGYFGSKALRHHYKVLKNQDRLDKDPKKRRLQWKVRRHKAWRLVHSLLAAGSVTSAAILATLLARSQSL